MKNMQQPKPRRSAKDHFLMVVNNTEGRDTSGFCDYSPTDYFEDKDPRDEFERMWEFRISLIPTQENLKKAGNLLANIFEGLAFKILLLNKPGKTKVEEIDWDGTRTFADNSDRDQCGKEFCVYMRYDPKKKNDLATKGYEKSPEQWKALILKALAALVDPKNGIDFGYALPTTGDTTVPVHGFYISPVTYTSFKPFDNRHGILLQSHHNPKKFDDPLREVVFTEKDFLTAGVDLNRLKMAQVKRIAYQRERLNQSKQQAVDLLMQADTSKTAHENPIDNLDKLTRDLEQQPTIEAKKAFVATHNKKFQNVLENFPRVADKELNKAMDIQALEHYLKTVDSWEETQITEFSKHVRKLTNPESEERKKATK